MRNNYQSYDWNEKSHAYSRAKNCDAVNVTFKDYHTELIKIDGQLDLLVTPEQTNNHNLHLQYSTIFNLSQTW